MPYVYFACFVVMILILKPNLDWAGHAAEPLCAGGSALRGLQVEPWSSCHVVSTFSVSGVMSLSSALLATRLNHDGPLLLLDIVLILTRSAQVSAC